VTLDVYIQNCVPTNAYIWYTNVGVSFISIYIRPFGWRLVFY